MKKSKPNMALASLLMVFSTSSFTLSGFFAGTSIERSSFWLALWMRFLIPLALIAPFYRMTTGHWRLERDRLQMARAFFLVISQGLFFYTSIKTSLFQAIVLYNTGPFFILLIDSCYSRKRIGYAAMVGVLLGFAGTAAVLWNGLASANYYVFVGVLSGVFFALSQFSLYLGSKSSSNLSILFHTYAYGVIFALPPLLWSENLGQLSAKLTPVLWSSFASLFLMAIFSLGNQWFRGMAYRRTEDVSALAPWLYFGIVVSLVLDILFKDKWPTVISLCGAALIIVGTLFSGMTQRVSRAIAKRRRERSGAWS